MTEARRLLSCAEQRSPIRMKPRVDVTPQRTMLVVDAFCRCATLSDRASLTPSRRLERDPRLVVVVAHHRRSRRARSVDLPTRHGLQLGELALRPLQLRDVEPQLFVDAR